MSPLSEHTFKTKVVGITRGERQRLLAALGPSHSVRLVRESDSVGHVRGIAVFVGESRLGWLKKEVAQSLGPLLADDAEPKAWLESVLKAREGHLECFIEIFYRGPAISVPGLRTRARKAKGEKSMRSIPKNIAGLSFFLALSLAAAAVGGAWTSTSVGSWYPNLAKPSWTAPNWVFGPVWTTLYILMAVAAWLIWKTETYNARKTCLRLYYCQLVLNAAWSGFFFGLRNPFLGFLEILVFWGVLTATTVSFWRVQRLAGILMAPYLGWATYAGVLNLALWRMNI